MTKAVLQVGTIVTKEASENITESICAVIKACYENRMEQDTTRVAILGISDALRVENVTIQNCHLVGDRTVNMDGKKVGLPNEEVEK